MTFSGVDSIVLLIGVALLGASVSTAAVLLRRSTERQHRNVQAVSAIAQLQKWRDTKLLVMADEDFKFALELEKHSPGQLLRLVRAIQRIIDEEKLESDDYIRLTVQVEYDDETEDVSHLDSRKGHLELIAEFA